MNNIAYYNGKESLLEDMMIPATDRGYYFGDGVYDATVVRHHKLFALDEHLDRFWRSMDAVIITPDFTKDELATLLNRLSSKVSNETYMVYWQVTRGSGERHHSFPKDAKPNLFVTITPMTVTREAQTRDFRIQTEEDIRSYMAHVKTLNLLPNVLSAQRAAEAGVDETVYYRICADGSTRVTEGSHTNVHMIKDGKLVTAPTDKLILPGIARVYLLQAARDLGMPVEERAFTKEELLTADEVFITSSLLFAGRVVSIDGQAAGQKAGELFIPLRERLIDEWFEETK